MTLSTYVVSQEAVVVVPTVSVAVLLVVVPPLFVTVT